MILWSCEHIPFHAMHSHPKFAQHWALLLDGALSSVSTPVTLFILYLQEHSPVVRCEWRLWDQAAGMAEEEPASLQPALWQTEAPVQRTRHSHQLRPGPGLTSHTEDAKGMKKMGLICPVLQNFGGMNIDNVVFRHVNEENGTLQSSSTNRNKVFTKVSSLRHIPSAVDTETQIPFFRIRAFVYTSLLRKLN